MMIFIILALFLVISNRRQMYKIEQFKTSPGTIVQLATSHVPTEEDARINREMVRRDIYDMTGSQL